MLQTQIVVPVGVCLLVADRLVVSFWLLQPLQIALRHRFYHICEDHLLLLLRDQNKQLDYYQK